MKKIKLFFTAVVLILSATVASAQSITVKGVVTDASTGEPIPFAALMIKGTTTGVSTDAVGAFSISAPAQGTLVVSSVGYQDAEVRIEGRTSLDITLVADAEFLDDVVVVAYGTSKKSSFTGSASQVGSQQLEKRVISNAMNALEGNMSGVQVTSASGQPGSGASIRIRGFGSVNASNSPLYVVDGAIYDGSISDINPADIESMTVLKDAASTSLYGSSAGNGVVLITTKAGSKGTASGVSLNIQQGLSRRAYKDYATLGLDDHMLASWGVLKGLRLSAGDDEATAAQYASSNLMTVLASAGLAEHYNPYKGVTADQIVLPSGQLNPAITGLKYGDDLDWDGLAYGTGYRQEYTLSYNSSTDKSDTYASVGYLNEDGYMVNTDFERYTGRLNYNLQPVKWFKTGLNLGFTRTNSTYSNATSSSTSSYANIQMFTRTIAPYYPIHLHDDAGAYLDVAGNVTTNPDDYQYDYSTRLVGTYVGRDGYVEQLWNNRQYNRMNESAKTYFTIMPIDGLSLTVNYSLNNTDYRSKRYENPYVGDGTAGPARLAIDAYRELSQTFNQIIQYTKSFGSNNLDVTLGHENYSYKYEDIYAMKVGETIHGMNDFANYTDISSLTSDTTDYRKEGYFGRINYDYASKYYASLSYRHDGTSRFSPENRWGDFWSFGVSWRLIQEDFLKNVSWLSNLKLRASYGETGNDNVSGYYPYQTLYGLGYTNGKEAGVYFTSMSNYNLKWETQVSSDLGLEFGMFDNRLTGTVELFRKDSKDLLFDVAQPISTGISSITQNIGKVSNKGVEIDLEGQLVKTKDWNVTLGANATFVKNVIVSLPEEMKQEGYINGSKKWMEGSSIYEFWLYQWQGVDPATGSGYYLINETKDDKGNVQQVDVPAADKIVVDGKEYTTSSTYAKKDFSGASIPKVYGGFNFNVAYRNFSLAATFSYQLGGKILDSSYATLMGNVGYGNKMAADLNNAWKKPGDITDVPRLDATTTTNTSWTQTNSTRWLTSSNYLNLRSVNLAYQLPDKVVDKINAKSARIIVACENVFMIKARQGLNPMANFTGLTYNEYMPSRNFTVGVNVGF